MEKNRIVIADKPYIIQFETIGEADQGFISVAEDPIIPFPVRRTHWTYNTPEKSVRGNHAHKNLRQIVIAAAGTVVVETETLTGATQSYTLNNPEIGLYLPAMCWRKLTFSQRAVLLCLASLPYDESDYIRDYRDFQSFRKVRA